jgi:hypothetical protein
MAFAQSNVSTGSFNSVFLEGTNGIAGSGSNLGIYYTTNSGQNWTQSISVITGNFNSVYLSGTNGIAGSGSKSNSGIYYTTDSGLTWTQSIDVTTGDFLSVYLSGTNGIAGSASGLGIYYTTNSGLNWAQGIGVATGNFNSVYFSGTNGIAGSGIGGPGIPGVGIYYSTSPICYDKNVEILCLIDGEEKLIKICEIEKDYLVKTYKQGYKKVKLIKGFNYKPINKNNDLECLYKMKNEEIILSGGHSILENELTKEEEENNKKYNFNEIIEDKKLLLACSSNKFEKINDDKEYILYHLVLENENTNGHYGIYLKNNILSESCSEIAFNRINNL